MKNSDLGFWNMLKWIIILAAIFFVFARIYYSLTDDFRLTNITYPLPYEESWNVSRPSPEEEKHLEKVLKQPYHYLGKGAQSYVFASEDGQYVIKFFKFKHLRPSVIVDNLPSIGFLQTYKEKQAERKHRKLYGVFKSYKLAYDVDKDESGLIFVQLNTQGNPSRFVTIIDKIGISRTLDLKNYPFILQYKGETLRTVLNDLLKDGQVEKAKMRLGQILDLYAGEYEKGIYDHDHGIMQNTGFIGDKPIHLDVGKLLREENMRDKKYAREDALIVVANMNTWISKNYPQYSDEFESYLTKKLEQLFGEEAVAPQESSDPKLDLKLDAA
jgi:hypothetical protein